MSNSPLTVEQRLALIEQSGWPIAWDGCHKLYFLQDWARLNDARQRGYHIYPSTKLRSLWNLSCSLRFITRWGFGNEDFEHEWNIYQFENEEE